MMTFPLEWLFVLALCLYSLWLARRLERALQELSDTQAELQMERRMRQQAEQAESEMHKTYLAMKNRWQEFFAISPITGERND